MSINFQLAVRINSSPRRIKLKEAIKSKYPGMDFIMLIFGAGGHLGEFINGAPWVRWERWESYLGAWSRWWSPGGPGGPGGGGGAQVVKPRWRWWSAEVAVARAVPPTGGTKARTAG